MAISRTMFWGWRPAGGGSNMFVTVWSRAHGARLTYKYLEEKTEIID